MKYKDKLNIIKKHIINKYSIIFCIFMIFMMTIFATASIVYYLYTITANDEINTSIDSRRITVYGAKIDKEKIQNISHVEVVDSYILGYYPVFVPMFQKKGNKGYIHLEPIVTSKDIITTNKIVLEPNETGYIVCPKKLNPDTSYKLKYSKLLNTKDYIGKTIIADDLNLTLIDTYDSDKFYEDKSVCFVSLHDFKLLKSKEYQDNDDLSTQVQVDSLENVNTVKEQLKEMGYRSSSFIKVDYDTIFAMKKISFITIIVTIIISILFITLIIIKKNKYEKKLNQLFFDIGMKAKEIKKYRNLELLILLIISIFISCLFSFLSYIILKHVIFNIFLHEGNMAFPYIMFILFMLILVIYVELLNSIRLKKELKQ